MRRLFAVVRRRRRRVVVVAAAAAAALKSRCAGLVNAALWRERYTFATSPLTPAGSYYERVLRVVGVWPLVSSLLLAYRGLERDDVRAHALHRAIFDEAVPPPNRGSSSLRCDRATAASADQGSVFLSKQRVFLNETSDFSATLELYEVYTGMHCARDEISYTFELPPGSAVHALYLGETGSRKRRVAGTVEPNVVARTAYNREVERRVDPALIGTRAVVAASAPHFDWRFG